MIENIKLIIDNLSSRESSLFIWVLIVFILGLFDKNIVINYINIGKAIFNKAILMLFLFLIIYLSLEFLILFEIGFWNKSAPKNLFVWLLTTCLVSLGDFFNLKKEPNYVNKQIKELFNLTIIIQFLIDEHTFNFWIEFTFLPIMFFLSGIRLTNKNVNTNKNGEIIEKSIKVIYFFIGLFILFNIVTGLINSLKTLNFFSTLIDLLFPSVLSFAFIPFIYITSWYSRIENLIVTIKHTCPNIENSSVLVLKVWRRLNFNITYLERWRDNILMFGLKNKQDLENETGEVLRIISMEEDTKYRPLSQGWGVKSARLFLEKNSLQAGNYNQLEKNSDSWFACSPYFNIGDEIIKNNIAYYIDGSNNIVKSLKVVANIHFNANSEIETQTLFATICSELFQKSMLFEVPDEIKDAISNQRNFSKTILKKTVLLEKNSWKTERGLNLSFQIKNSEY